MKNKLTAVIVAVALSLSVFLILGSAATLMKGDIDGDGKITANDARMVLRYTASLEQFNDDQIKASDVTGDDGTTAADARMILRISAGLEKIPEDTTETTETESTTTLPEITTSQQCETYPAAIDAFFSGEFYLNAMIDEQGDTTDIQIATDGKNVEMGMDLDGTKMSVLVQPKTMYLKATASSGKKYYVEVTESMKNSYGLDSINIDEILSSLDFGSIDDFGKPILSESEYNGTACNAYTFSKNESTSLVFYAVGEKVIGIRLFENENVSTDITVNELSATFPDGVLSLKGFTMTNILIFSSLIM